jgi:hypothetical protein
MCATCFDHIIRLSSGTYEHNSEIFSDNAATSCDNADAYLSNNFNRLSYLVLSLFLKVDLKIKLKVKIVVYCCR